MGFFFSRVSVACAPQVGTATSRNEGSPQGKSRLSFSKGTRLTITQQENGKWYATDSKYNTLWFPLSSTEWAGNCGYTKLEYLNAETLLSSSGDGTMRVWSVDTGAPKEELDGRSLAFSKDSSSQQKVSKYSIAFKDDLLLISEDQSVVAFFRAPSVISTIGTAGERIGVGCTNGEVLQLRADWLG